MIFTPFQFAAKNHVSLAEAIETVNAIKQNFLSGQVGKSTRPWFVLDFPSMFAEDATLVGFEIETGFSNRAGQLATMTWLWDNTDFVTSDYEGCSNHPTEITFPPIEIEELLAGTSQIHDLLAYSNAADRPAAERLRVTNVNSDAPNGGSIGCHTNISTAKWRAAQRTHRTVVTERLQSFFNSLGSGARYALYGRQPYRSGVVGQRGGDSNDAAPRLEFKMFHTTTNVTQFNNYIKVSARLAQLIDHLLDNAGQLQQLGMDNNKVFKFLLQDCEFYTVIANGNAQYNSQVYTASASIIPTTAAVPDLSELLVHRAA